MTKNTIWSVRVLLTASAVLFAAAIFPAGAQTYSSVAVDDPVYYYLEQAELRGLCTLPGDRPYTEKLIVSTLDKIISAASDNGKLFTQRELDTLKAERARFDRKEGFDLSKCEYYWKSLSQTHTTIAANFNIYTNLSGSYYDSLVWGGDLYPTASVKGDVGNNLSYNFTLFGVATRAPLTLLGTYDITNNWAESTGHEDLTINTYSNRAYFPYSYSKLWDGSVYKLSNMTASGLEGWSDGGALGFGILSELDASCFEDKLSFRFGRLYREWAAMENGASLVLNSAARPFLAGEARYEMFPWLTFSTLSGILEMPNAGYIYGDSADKSGYSYTDYIYQNAYSIDMTEVNFKYFHGDFGTICIWPKRFELGYIFPLMNKVFYQNNIGDYDNIQLFVDLKGKLPQVGTVWASLFLDEMNGFSTKNGLLSGPAGLFTYDRDMFALQGGTQIKIPWLPFCTLSLRYTKVEPYCYTHHGVSNTPWYEGYVSEAYLNNGECIGYYLDPNSDEVYARLESKLSQNTGLHLQYQLIRHGAAYGDQSVDGSSLYSELATGDNRDDMRKYFLHDGAYEWYNIIKVGGEHTFRPGKIPVTLYGDIGYVYEFCTEIDSSVYSAGTATFDTPITIATDGVYAPYGGVVITGGVKIWL